MGPKSSVTTVPIRTGKFRHRERHRADSTRGQRQGRSDASTGRGKPRIASNAVCWRGRRILLWKLWWEPGPGDTLISGFWLPERWENSFKPSSLWHLVMIVLGKYNSGEDEEKGQLQVWRGVSLACQSCCSTSERAESWQSVLAAAVSAVTSAVRVTVLLLWG